MSISYKLLQIVTKIYYKLRQVNYYQFYYKYDTYYKLWQVYYKLGELLEIARIITNYERTGLWKFNKSLLSDDEYTYN